MSHLIGKKENKQKMNRLLLLQERERNKENERKEIIREKEKLFQEMDEMTHSKKTFKKSCFERKENLKITQIVIVPKLQFLPVVFTCIPDSLNYFFRFQLIPLIGSEK